MSGWRSSFDFICGLRNSEIVVLLRKVAFPKKKEEVSSEVKVSDKKLRLSTVTIVKCHVIKH